MTPRRRRPITPGLPGGPDGPPSNRPKAASSLAPIALVLAVVLGVWLLNGRDPGTGTSSGPPSDTPSYVGTYQAPSSGSSGASATASVQSTDAASGLSLIAAQDLPPEARDVLALIDDGGPFAYDEDGTTFGNFEGLLPEESRGYYAEYTVETPGSSSRGARRIVAGDGGERYWTADHYTSFARVAP